MSSNTEELRVIENGMVPVYEADGDEQVVYGTELHAALGVKSNCREWMRRRLKDIDAVEGEDFQGVEISTPSGQTRKEYIISLDTAKEMAMLERNAKGKQIRKYFIRVEKRYRTHMRELSLSMKRFMTYQAVKNQEQEDAIKALRDSVERLQDRSALPDYNIYHEGSSQYQFADRETIEARKKELLDITLRVAEMFNYSHTYVLHQLYTALGKRCGTDINAYKAVYRAETGLAHAGMIEVVAANDRLYKEAVSMNAKYMQEDACC